MSVVVAVVTMATMRLANHCWPGGALAAVNQFICRRLISRRSVGRATEVTSFLLEERRVCHYVVSHFKHIAPVWGSSSEKLSLTTLARLFSLLFELSRHVASELPI